MATLLNIVLNSQKEQDVNKTIDDIRSLIKDCVPKYSVESAEYNNAIYDFFSNLSQKGLITYAK